ncbi:PREDICTED: B-box zinc finger protein 21-like isoform X2 [Nicotiana attenuata]|uniref:B-box zinc finger protein 21 n=1 Tax=Nicotiana attenuata TaxID=49451 RepID=A0A314KV87_NICAT|nr:PREDICTED: B-box zinc finger protein 21-like isoform X2 [Nicotiana attenuata]OIT33411.1 b-box zinc finger protein 21 [Nicotiana attenuata]
MKIQCDVCNKNEASVFCTADEAALCEACDHRVHHVNKLASKHERFSLLQPSTKQFPLCDICQERRAILFCQQDRAILCRECDLPIHKANEHTQKHNRYLFTGIKLSANSALYSSTPSPSAASSANSSASSFKSQNPTNKPAAVETVTVVKEKVGGCNSQLVNVGGNNLTSSISEYLEMLPGWHVEDFLDCSTPNGSSKIGDEDMLSFWDTDLESHMSSFPPQNIGVWVPQAPPPLQSKQQTQTQFLSPSNLNFGGQIGIKDSREVNSIKSSRKWRDDNSFAVPQISPPSTSFKRSRTLW